MNIVEKKKTTIARLLTLFYFAWSVGEVWGGGNFASGKVYGKYILHFTPPAVECFQKLVSNPAMFIPPLIYNLQN